MRGRKRPKEEFRGRKRAGERDAARVPRRPSFLWLLGFFLLGALAVSLPYLYRRHFMSAEGESKVEAELERLKEKLKEIKDRAEGYIPTDLDELQELARKVEETAGSVREEAFRKLRERGLDPAELKKKIEELKRKIKGRKDVVQDHMQR